MICTCLCLATSLALPCPPGTAGQESRTFHVSTVGDDSWSGRLAEPAADGADGPFATVHRAQRAVRERLAAGRSAAPLLVSLRGGVYELAEPLVFTHEDSGAVDRPVVYASYPGERAILSGGRRITDWKVGDDGRWRTTLPGVRSRAWSFAQLWVNDQRRFRPRLPREGFARVALQVTPSLAAAGKGHDRFGFHPGDLDPAWRGLDDVEILAFHIWSASRMRIGKLDTAENVVTFTGPTRTTARWGAFLPGHRYLAINVADALGVPGDWHLDETSGELCYVPRPGETPAAATVVAPRLETLVRFEGDVGGRRFAQHLVLKGLTFAHAGWTLPAAGQSFPQAEVHLGAAIEAVGARDVVFDDCIVRHVGQYAVALGVGCRDVSLQGCDLIDLGAGGVKIGNGGGSQSWMVADFDPEDPESAVERVTVSDCLIAFGGRLHPAAVGVWIGHAAHCTILHNDIHDLYYTGISVGWVWGYAEPSRAHHNEISYNRIHHIGGGVLSDMAGVYTLGVSPGTRVHHNVIHDVMAFDYGGWGLYTDEGSSGIELTHNLVYRTKTGGFHQHYGRENRIAHNIFAQAEMQQLQRTRTEEHLSFTFERNIVYWTGTSPLLGSNWRDDHFVLDRNLYWNPEHPEIRFPGDLTFAQWRAERGQDRMSVITDPRFVDPGADDFSLGHGSPALELGFEHWDHALAGRRGGSTRTAQLPPVPAGFE